MVLPHCLRHADCEAKLESSGLVCKDCNRCVIGVLKNKGEGMGFKVFIIPGSTFLKKILEKNDFKAVLGVACYQDLNLVNDETIKIFMSRCSTFKGWMYQHQSGSKSSSVKMGEIQEKEKRQE